ncbi:hypothetical protein ISCU110981_19015 [Isoptericola cucumis]
MGVAAQQHQPWPDPGREAGHGGAVGGERERRAAAGERPRQGVPGVRSGEGRAQLLDGVHHDEHRRRPGRRRGVVGGEPPQQACRAAGVVRPGERAEPGVVRERREGVLGGARDESVHVPAPVQAVAGEGEQRRRAAGAGGADDRKMPVGRGPGDQAAALVARVVAERDGQRRRGAGRPFGLGGLGDEVPAGLVGGHQLRQRGQPRRRAGRQPAPGGGGAQRDHHPVGVVRPGRAVVGDPVRGHGAGPVDGPPGGGTPHDRAGGPRRTGVGALEDDGRRGTEPQHGPAGDTGADAGRRRGVDDVQGVGRVHHAQRDACRHVGAHVRTDRARGTLGREHEVHAEGAPLRRHPQQAGQELRQVVGQRAELVDDDDEARRRVRVPVQGGEVGDAVRRQQLLAAVQLRAEPGERPAGEPGVEVRDLAHHVREAGAGPERGTALEVDEGEREVARRPPGREPEHEGLQELGLARPGGPGHQQVRPVGDEVQVHGAAGGVDAEGDGPAGGVPPGAVPVRRSVGVVRAAVRPPARVGVQEPGERDRAGQARVGGVDVAGRPVRPRRARGAGGSRARPARGVELRELAPHPGEAGRPPRHPLRPRRRDPDGGRRLRAPVGCPAVERTAGVQLPHRAAPRRGYLVVGQAQHDGVDPLVPGAVGRAGRHLRDRPRVAGPRDGDRRRGPRLPGDVHHDDARPAVRQPAAPRPRVPARTEHGHGRAAGSQVDDHRPGDGPDAVPRPAHRERAVGHERA